MPEIDILDAEKLFDILLDRVERGEEITITRDGKAVAKLVSAATKLGVPVLGYSEGQ
jgi:prevent-host-death family protein